MDFAIEIENPVAIDGLSWIKTQVNNARSTWVAEGKIVAHMTP